MQALGNLSPIDEARARLQDKIGELLSGRAKLSRLMGHPSLQIQSQAKSLYAAQVSLEDQFYKDMMPKIKAVQEGAWSFSDVATLANYTSMIIAQIDSVNKLERQAGVSMVQPTIGEQVSTFALPIVAVSGLVILYLLWSK